MKKYMGAFKQNISLNTVPLSKRQIWTFLLLIIATILIRIILIPYNAMDMGDSATRVWNALWWSRSPFVVLPSSGHPFWFYFMGSILYVTHEIFYTPAIVMILLMTIAGIYIFKTTFLISNYPSALLAFLIMTLNPVIFRLNFEPYAQQTYLTSVCILMFFFIQALAGFNSRKNFLLAGIFAFMASFSRPEAIFVLIPLCLVAYLNKNKGWLRFVLLSIIFQVIWVIVSQLIYGSPFKTFQAADEYTGPVNIESISMGLRLKGFFLPYYFLIFGLTIFVFYFFIRGLIYYIKKYPAGLIIALMIPILFPALINGIAGAKSTVYHTTHYIYLMFFISPVFAGIGLYNSIEKIKGHIYKYSLASFVLLSMIPLSYIKEFVPLKFNKLFPKVIELTVLPEEPEETNKLLEIIDHNIDKYPSLIFDSNDNTSGIFYVPYRTRLAPPEKILITSYNMPVDVKGLAYEINKFIDRNKKGILMVRKNPTPLNTILKQKLILRPLTPLTSTSLWDIYVYE